MAEASHARHKSAVVEALRILHRDGNSSPEPGDEPPKGYRRGSLRKHTR